MTYYRKLKNKLQFVFSDKSIKPLIQIIFELIKTAIMTRGLPKHYFISGLYRKGIDNYLDYLTQKECFKIHAVMHDRSKKQVLDNKFFFQKYFDQTKIRIPKMLAHNFGKMYYLDGHKMTVDGIGDFFEILNKLIEGSGSNSIIVKPMMGSFGEGIFKIKYNDISQKRMAEKEELFNKICSGNYIFQENIMQHSKINKIYSESLNTVRIDTFVNDDGEPEIISAMMRVGRNGGHTDNLSGGGILIGIDLETGCLRKNGMTFLKYGANVFTHHPNSGFEFENFKIPFFNEAVIMAKEAAHLLFDRLVGWDIGISENGPVLIEGNAYYLITCMEMANGGYRRHPVFMKVIDKAMRK